MVRLPVFSLAAWLATAATAQVAADWTHVLEVQKGWEYAPTANPPATDRLPDAWEPVTLPHRLDTEPCGLFRTSFAVPAAWAGYRVSLVVRPLGGTAWVWLNGQSLGARAPIPLDIRLDVARALRPGVANTLLVAVAQASSLWDTGKMPVPPGLAACWLEATTPIAIGRAAASTWRLGQTAVVDAALDVSNQGRDRFEGKLELALEPDAPDNGRHPVWRRGTDVRLDPDQSAAVAHSFEVDPPRPWRFDDPFLYRLTATVRTRDGQVVGTLARGLGLREVTIANGRWLANGDTVRLTGVALSVRGALLLCTQPGQASALAARLAPEAAPRLANLLDFCDATGVLAFLDAPAAAPETPGWPEALADLAAEAAAHPCVWGWVVRGEAEASAGALARLRELTPRLPVGCPMPDLAADAAGFDFLVSRFATRPGREDDDPYGRRLDELARDAGGRPVIVVDRLTEAADRARADGSLARRCREAERRSLIAALAFELEPDEALFRVAEKRLCPFALKPPRHEARLDGDRFVVKSRFEVHLASPVAQRIPCYSLGGYRLAWRAAIVGGTSPSRDTRREDTPPTGEAASGALPLGPAAPRSVEGGVGPARAETEWRVEKGGDVEFVVELQSAAGRVLARHRTKLSLEKKDDKAELRVTPREAPEPAAPAPAAADENIECIHLDALARFFSNDGISWRSNPQEGNFDFPSRRNGSSFIADLLPKKGALVEVPGRPAVTFRFPDKDDRLRNNVLCDGQRLALAKPYEAFDAAWFLGACHDGARAALLEIEYEDGYAQGELRLADWCSKPAAGEIDVLRLAARHNADGQEEQVECGLVAWRVPLDPKRKLVAITLPRERNMHLFAATLTRTRNP